jgi:hypothetical protein
VEINEEENMKTSTFGSGDDGYNSGSNEKIVDIQTQKVVRIYRSNGTFQDYPVSNSLSLPDEQGNLRNIDVDCRHFDRVGSLLPADMKDVSESPNGGLIPPDKRAECTSTLHQQGVSRNFYINVDGIVTEQGGICDDCQRRRTNLRIVSIVLGICLLIGFIKGLGWF